MDDLVWFSSKSEPNLQENGDFSILQNHAEAPKHPEASLRCALSFIEIARSHSLGEQTWLDMAAQVLIDQNLEYVGME